MAKALQEEYVMPKDLDTFISSDYGNIDGENYLDESKEALDDYGYGAS